MEDDPLFPQDLPPEVPEPPLFDDDVDGLDELEPPADAAPPVDLLPDTPPPDAPFAPDGTPADGFGAELTDTVTVPDAPPAPPIGEVDTTTPPPTGDDGGPVEEPEAPGPLGEGDPGSVIPPGQPGGDDAPVVDEPAAEYVADAPPMPPVEGDTDLAPPPPGTGADGPVTPPPPPPGVGGETGNVIGGPVGSVVDGGGADLPDPIEPVGEPPMPPGIGGDDQPVGEPPMPPGIGGDDQPVDAPPVPPGAGGDGSVIGGPVVDGPDLDSPDLGVIPDADLPDLDLPGTAPVAPPEPVALPEDLVGALGELLGDAGITVDVDVPVDVDTTIGDLVGILDAQGVPASVTTGTVDDLATHVASGTPVVVSTVDPSGFASPARITDVDTARGRVVLTPLGGGAPSSFDLSELLDRWGDAFGEMFVALDEPVDADDADLPALDGDEDRSLIETLRIGAVEVAKLVVLPIRLVVEAIRT